MISALVNSFPILTLAYMMCLIMKKATFNVKRFTSIAALLVHIIGVIFVASRVALTVCLRA
jgi:hypothetical protein